MSTLTQGAMVVIPNLLDRWPDYDDPDSQPVRINAMGIIEDDPQMDGSYTVKYVGPNGEVRLCVMGPDDEVVVLTQGADPTRDISKELVRLLPEVIANLAVVSRSAFVAIT